MKTFLLALLALALVLTVYALLIRPWLRKRGLAPWWFEAVDRIELTLFKKSETILFARLKVAVGILLSLLTDLSGMDLTPLMPFVPEEWMGTVQLAIKALPLLLSLVGWADERLRYDTTKPIDVVAVSVDAPAEVQAAVAVVEATNAEAVATVKVAQAEAAAKAA
jgi:hypothetical protein